MEQPLRPLDGSVQTIEADESEIVVRLARLAGKLSSSLIQLSAVDVEAAIDATLRQIVETLDADRSTLLEFSEDASRVESAYSWQRPGIPAYQLDVDLPKMAWLMERVRQGEAFILPSPAALPPEAVLERAYAREVQMKSAVCLPIAVGGRRICSLAVGCFRQPRQWDPSTVDGIRFVAEILAASLHRRRQERALVHSRDEIARLTQGLEPENLYLREEINDIHGFDEIVGDSPALKAALNLVQEVAPTDTTVLLYGETGTGKELFARAVHDRSARRQRPLVRVNCAALPATLIESELFGHERGAYTGAVSTRQGRFELADRGTIFLDEIGDLPLEVQAKLLRVLQEGEFERLGSSHTRRVDVRVIAATHRNLEKAVEQGQFRADLYYRISVFPVELPPLRVRKEDIPRLVWFYIHDRKRSLHRNIDKVPVSVIQSLQQYDWPGNVRELENVIERALIRSTGDTLVLDQGFGSRSQPIPSSEETDNGKTLDQVERRHIEEVLRTCGWRIDGRGNAAEQLGLHPNTLRFRMKKLGIHRPAKVSAGPTAG